MASIEPFGNDRPVTSGAGSQEMPAISAHPDGGYVMAWVDYSSSGYDIYTARFAALGSAQAGVRANADATNRQLHPAITVLPSGGWVVTWTDDSFTGPPADASSWAVRGQLFAPDGTMLGPEFLVNSTTQDAQWQPQVVPLAGGGFVVAWINLAGYYPDTVAQIFDGSGNKVGGEITAGLGYATITPMADGGFLSAYYNEASGWTGDNVHIIDANRFGALGQKVGSFRIANGDLGHVVEIDSVTLTNGNFVIAWVVNEGRVDGDGYGIRAQVFDPSGEPLGTPFRVNSYHLGDQFQIDMSALPGGGFAVVWSDAAGSGGDGSSYSIKAQVFDGSGEKMLDEFLVNSTTASIQQNPAATTLADGRLVIVWQHHSNPGAGSDYDIMERVFAVPVTPPEEPDPSPGPDTFTGTPEVDQFAGMGGDDTFNFPVAPLQPQESGTPYRSTWGSGDTVDGGADRDRMVVSGAVTIQLGPQSLLGVETLQFLPAGPGKMFPARNVTMHDANVAAGAALRVDASALPYGESLYFYGQKELDGRFTVLGGANNDIIRGGAQEDDIRGGLGADELLGNGGDDFFHFESLQELRGYPVQSG